MSQAEPDELQPRAFEVEDRHGDRVVGVRIGWQEAYLCLACARLVHDGLVATIRAVEARVAAPPKSSGAER